MGGFFGAISKRDVSLDIFFGVDYHSHLGTRRGGMIIYDEADGFQRQIHSIENTPFRTKFEKDLQKFHGSSGIAAPVPGSSFGVAAPVSVSFSPVITVSGSVSCGTRTPAFGTSSGSALSSPETFPPEPGASCPFPLTGSSAFS